MKDEIRKQYITLRKHIVNKKEKSLIIKDKLLSLLNKYHVIGVYVSMDDEVFTDELIQELLNQSIEVVVPKIEGHVINFYQISSLNSLKTTDNKYGIREPDNNIALKVKKEAIEAMIIPGIVFDTSLHRIGFGKGYFDKYLANTNVYKIGICFDEQLSNAMIPHHSYDVKMDIIITDQRTIKDEHTL